MASSTIVHVLQILSAILCLHSIYPKGITYGDREDWELKAKERREGNKQEGRRRPRKDRERDRGREEFDGYDDYEYRRVEKRAPGGNGNARSRVRRTDEVRYIDR